MRFGSKKKFVRWSFDSLELRGETWAEIEMGDVGFTFYSVPALSGDWLVEATENLPVLL